MSFPGRHLRSNDPHIVASIGDDEDRPPRPQIGLSRPFTVKGNTQTSTQWDLMQSKSCSLSLGTTRFLVVRRAGYHGQADTHPAGLFTVKRSLPDLEQLAKGASTRPA